MGFTFFIRDEPLLIVFRQELEKMETGGQVNNNKPPETALTRIPLPIKEWSACL